MTVRLALMGSAEPPALMAQVVTCDTRCRALAAAPRPQPAARKDHGFVLLFFGGFFGPITSVRWPKSTTTATFIPSKLKNRDRNYHRMWQSGRGMLVSDLGMQSHGTGPLASQT